MAKTKTLAIGVALAAVLGGSTVAHASFPLPHTPCAAESNGKHPEQHVRFWLANGWRSTDVGWVNTDGNGCYL